ncbi:MAG TPA: alpha/beta fold hydrolase, partial [Steroidobacteraceae bacterium]|nr:alpha/beta fold hydrolase [Steroidobacteraceae bacterium]
MRRREFKSTGMGGLDLHAQAWLPEGHVRAVFAVAHGLGEHSGRYATLADELVAQGHAVYAIDHRGHGRSPGARANIERFDYLVSDFCAFTGRASRQHPDTPVFMLGHSMGGAVAFASALRLQGSLRGLVLSAPALGTDEVVAPGRRILARALS